jgi:hypothetical protein
MSEITCYALVLEQFAGKKVHEHLMEQVSYCCPISIVLITI